MDLAAPDDPGAWYAVGNMWPTKRGTYETAYVGGSGIDYTASGATTVKYAFGAKTLSGLREYVIDGKIWEFSGSALTDRTNSVSIGSQPMMTQYGNITICVMGASTATVSSSGGNFSALAGAPQGEIVCVQSNAVLIFNTNTSADGWAASDVGDYTNWSTGEAASGRIIATPGPVTAAVPYGNDVIVFKPDAIYRMTYVGGTVKWQIQLVWKGLGVAAGSTSQAWKYQAVSTSKGAVFLDAIGNSTGYAQVYLFDGASPPVHLNPFNRFGTNTGQYHALTYSANNEMVCLAPTLGCSATGTNELSLAVDARYFYYSLISGMWGAGNGSAGEVDSSGVGSGNGIVFGGFAADSSYIYPKPIYWGYQGTAGNLKRVGSGTYPSSCYLQTSKVGSNEFKTTFDRLIPQLRRRTDLGTDSASLEMTLFREREDTSAQTTRTISESSTRKRFDLNGGACSDNFARFKVTWTALDVEVDDFTVKSRPAGTD